MRLEVRPAQRVSRDTIIEKRNELTRSSFVVGSWGNLATLRRVFVGTDVARIIVFVFVVIIVVVVRSLVFPVWVAGVLVC